MEPVKLSHGRVEMMHELAANLHCGDCGKSRARQTVNRPPPSGRARWIRRRERNWAWLTPRPSERTSDGTDRIRHTQQTNRDSGRAVAESEAAAADSCSGRGAMTSSQVRPSQHPGKQNQHECRVATRLALMVSDCGRAVGRRRWWVGRRGVYTSPKTPNGKRSATWTGS